MSSEQSQSFEQSQPTPPLSRDFPQKLLPSRGIPHKKLLPSRGEVAARPEGSSSPHRVQITPFCTPRPPHIVLPPPKGWHTKVAWRASGGTLLCGLPQFSGSLGTIICLGGVSVADYRANLSENQSAKSGPSPDLTDHSRCQVGSVASNILIIS